MNNNSNLEEILKKLKEAPEAKIDPIFKQNAKIRLLNKISTSKASKKKKNLLKQLMLFFYQFKLPLAFLGILLVVGGGSVFAAQGSLPGEPLYSVKVASEKVLLALTPSWMKDDISSEIFKRREEEIKKLQIKGANEDLIKKIQGDLEKGVKEDKSLENKKNKNKEEINTKEAPVVPSQSKPSEPKKEIPKKQDSSSGEVKGEQSKPQEKVQEHKIETEEKNKPEEAKEQPKESKSKENSKPQESPSNPQSKR